VPRKPVKPISIIWNKRPKQVFKSAARDANGTKNEKTATPGAFNSTTWNIGQVGMVEHADLEKAVGIQQRGDSFA